jgi:peptide/nickel transport system permease protein
VAARPAPHAPEQGRPRLRRCCSSSSRSRSSRPLLRTGRQTGPEHQHLTDTSRSTASSATSSTSTACPIGPQGFAADGKYVLGADRNGRDVMVRLLYGARNSLFIGLTASLITSCSPSLGLLAGYFRGWVDAIISRGLDILWAFPVLLLGIALGVALASAG